MKLFFILSTILLLGSCASSKKTKSAAEFNQTKILYSGYHSEVDGKIEIKLVSSKEIMCTANIIQISCDSFADEMIRLAAVNGKVTLKLLDEKSYYFTPTCNGKTVKLLIQYYDNYELKLLKSLTIKVSK